MDELKLPLQIAPNLEAGVLVAGHWVTVGYDGQTSDGRDRYRWTVIFPDNTEESDNDLYSGVGGGNLTYAMAVLLAFLSAAAERRQYEESTDKDSEETELFPDRTVQFATENSDELDMLGAQIEEGMKAK